MEKETIEQLRKVANLKETLYGIRHLVISLVALMLVGCLLIVSYTIEPSGFTNEELNWWFGLLKMLSFAPFIYFFYSIAETVIPKKSEKKLRGMVTESEVIKITEKNNDTFNEDEKIFVRLIFGIETDSVKNNLK